MNLYVLLNDENRIVMVTVQKQNDEQFEFTFPADFDVTDIINWKIVDGELVHDEMPIPEPEKEPDTSFSIEGFDINKTYVKGDYFGHNGNTYKVIANTIKGIYPPDSFYYEKVDMLEELKALNTTEKNTESGEF